jgi:putative ABC transport system permease protein
MQTDFTIFSFALRNLKRKPLRTAILIAAIAILVAALVFAISFVSRVSSSVRLASERLGADILVVPAGSRGAAEDVLLENKAKSFYMNRNVLDKLKTIKGIEQLTHQTYLATIIGKCCDVPETVVVAFNQDTDFVVTPWLNKKFGRKLQKGEALVGSESAFNIRVELVDVDKVLFGNTFKMVGVLDKTGTGLDNALFINEDNLDDIMRKGQTSLKPDQISIVFIKVKKGFDSYKVAGEIEDAFVELDTMARKDIGKSIIMTLRDINQIFIFTMSLISLLSGFLTWAIFSAIANERAREVGIMRAVGARESHIVAVFLKEVIIVGSIGSIIGIVGGTVLSIILAKSFSIMKSLPIHVTVLDRLLIACIGFILGNLICIAGALSPIQKIKKMEPLMAIKRE